MTALTDAIRGGDPVQVAALLDSEPSLVNVREGNVTPLLLAIYHGKFDLAQYLLEHGARVSFGEAVALGDRARVEKLLAEDPRLLHARTADGFPPVGLAIFFRHGELARWLIEQGADVSAAADNAQRVAPVHAAAAVCDRETMRMLLERGADVHAKQQSDYTPLHGAASRGDIEMGKLLLEYGASPGAKASDGMTPAAVARKYGHVAFAEWLERTT
ncbi:MAG TPA: ankyrin repeat domain-containing protein [Thermoanaerobaculia bacterium]|jgi:ankyrin repeat protein